MTDDRPPGSDADAAASRTAAGWEASRLARLRARFASPWAAVGFAHAAVGAGLAVRWSMNDPGIRFVILYPTVAVAALVAGPIAGLTATAVAALGAEFLFFAPVWATGAALFADTMAVANFVLTGLLMSLVAAVDRAEAQRMLAGMLRGRAAEEHHRTVVEALLEGVIVFDADGRVTAANPSAERLLGLSLDELRRTFRSIAEWPLMREDGSPLAVEDLPAARVLRDRRPIHDEVVEFRLADRSRWFLFNAVPIFEPGGDRIASVVISFDDVTERRLAEREISEGRTRLKTLFSVLNEGVILFAADGRVLSHNPAAERILGHPPGVLDDFPAGFRGWDLAHEDGTRMEIPDYPVVRVFASGEAIHGQVLGAIRGDEIVWLLNNADPMFDPTTGEIAAVVVSFADITERRRIEKALAESRARLASVFEALHEAVLVFDAEGRTLSCNRAAETVLRCPTAQLLEGEGFLGLGRRTVRADGTPFPVEERPIRRVLAGNPGQRGTVVGIGDQTDTFWLEVNDQPIRDARTGAIVAVVASFSDITDRIVRERELAESRAHLASIFTAVHEGILVYSSDGRVLNCNPAAGRLLRRSADELRAARSMFSATGALDENGRPLAIDDYPVVRTLRTGEAVHGVVVGLPFDDGTVWLLVNSEPIADPVGGGIGAAVVSINDVTERLHARRQLEESRARFASVVSSAMDAIVSVDEDQRVVLFNTAAERVFGLSAAEALGRPLAGFIPERFRDRHDASFRRFAVDPDARRDTPDAGARTFFGLRADGTEFPFEASVSRVEIDGKPLFNIVLRDITARLAAERVDAQLAAVVRSSPDAILTVSMEGRFETWNDAATRMFGYTEAEAVGAPIDIIFFPNTPDGGTANFERIRRGEAFKIEAVRRRADGSPLEVMTSAAPIRDSSGRIVAAVAILSDISERKRKERELAERDQELRQTLDAAGLGVWWLDTETALVHCDSRSRALFDLTEVEPLDVLARRLHLEDRDALLDLPHRLADTGTGLALVLRRQAADGAVSWLSLTARSRRRPGHGEEIWGTVQDVTEARRAEEAMRRSEASRRLEALGRMTGGIAHDLNNLLTVVSGNLQLLEMSPGSDKTGRWIAEALRASESGAALNERLLTFARRRRLAPSLTDLNDLVGAMIDMLHRSVGAHVTVVTVLGADLGLVRVDAAEIENAVLNLVLNARDAMPEGGRIVVETSNTWVDQTTMPAEEGVHVGEYVRLTVSDNGHGMAPDVAARAFEPFFTTKEIGRGSGLGLATLHGFIHQSGGFVTLYSEVDHGTAVNLYLPRGDTSADIRAAAVERRPVRGHGETILVVEDDAAVRRVTRERLEALGYRVETAANAPAALDILAAGRSVDLVFTDVVMPGGLSGLDLARGLRADDPRRRILVTSGFAEDFTDGRQAGETGFLFLRKPHSLIELADAIAAALAPEEPTA
mgnify:CR=1 FL=1